MFSKVAIIGTGNVGTWLFQTLHNNKVEVAAISSRKIETLPPNFDLYIFAVKDDVYEDVLKKITFRMPHAVHTSGSLSQNILAPYADNFGVIYPYQSITKAENTLNPYLLIAPLVAEKEKRRKGEKEKRRKGEEEKGEISYGLTLLRSYGLIPVCIEASTTTFEDILYHWTNTMFDNVHKVSEKQRFAMHLAAVFANNFTNAMYGIAYDIFKENSIDWSLIFPLLENTLEKVKHQNPKECQTGPAKRGDISIMEKHCNALHNNDLKELYNLISEIISKFSLNL